MIPVRQWSQNNPWETTRWLSVEMARMEGLVWKLQLWIQLSWTMLKKPDTLWCARHEASIPFHPNKLKSNMMIHVPIQTLFDLHNIHGLIFRTTISLTKHKTSCRVCFDLHVFASKEHGREGGAMPVSLDSFRANRWTLFTPQNYDRWDTVNGIQSHSPKVMALFMPFHCYSMVLLKGAAAARVVMDDGKRSQSGVQGEVLQEKSMERKRNDFNYGPKNINFTSLFHVIHICRVGKTSTSFFW